MKGVPLDPLYQRAMEFAKNYGRTNNMFGVSNLYVIQRKDRDGNVLEEKYGMNVMTDYGVSQYFVSSNTFPKTIYIGGGSGTISHTSSELLSPLTEIASTASDTSINYNYPLYYHELSGLITTVTRYVVAYFDYELNEINTPLSVTEYGIGTSPRALWTHSWVYDNLGRQATITKKPHERLEITVFFCMSYDRALIDEAWDNGRCIIITNMARFFDNRMYENNIETFKRNGLYYVQGKNRMSSIFQNHVLLQTTNMTSFTLLPGNSDDKGYIDGFVNWHAGMNMMERVLMDHDIPFDIITQPQRDRFSEDNCLAYNIGHKDYLPFTDIQEGLESFTFNYETGEYDCEDNIDYDPSVWYNDTPMTTSFPTTLRYTNNQTVMSVYVYRNMRTDDPIIAIKGALQTVYATNEYWNTSSWVMISNPTQIPEEVQHAKYWITTSNTVNIEPVHGKKELTFVCNDGAGLQRTYFEHVKTLLAPQLSNPEYQYYMIGNEIYDLEHNYSIVTVGTQSNINNTYSVCYEKSIVTFNSASSGFWFTNVSTNSATPSLIDNQASISNLWNCYITESKTGFVLVKDLTSGPGSLLKINLIDGQCEQSVINDCHMACAITMSDKYAFISTDNPQAIQIRSLADDQVEKTINIPEGEVQSDPTIIFGYRNLVYVGITNSYMYVINTTTGSIRSCTMYTTPSLVLQSVRIEAVENHMLVYDYTKPQCSNAMIFEYSNPSVVRNLADLFTTVNGETYSMYRLQYLNNKTLVLIYHCHYYTSSYSYLRTVIADLGHYLYHGEKTDDTWVESWTERTDAMMIPYGDRIANKNVMYQLANIVPHRLKGNTKTVTAIDAYKNIQNKSWELKFTNVAEWTGLPPGSAQ